MRKGVFVVFILALTVLSAPSQSWAKPWRITTRSRCWHYGFIGLILHQTLDPGGLFQSDPDLERKVTDLEKQVGSLRVSVEVLQSDLDRAGQRIAELQKQLETAEQAVSDYGEALDLAQKTIGELNSRLASAEDSLERVQPLVALADYVTVVEDESINGLKGPHVIFTGVNVHVRSGSGYTDDGGSPQGLGNVIIGYNEEPDSGLDAGGEDRSGSHNLIMGPKHRYSGCGNLVAGSANTARGSYTALVGGQSNTASGDMATVTGGLGNTASDYCSTVSGGRQNRAGAYYAAVSGGLGNQAVGFYSSVSGGQSNTARGVASTVAGGSFNTASGEASSISGGRGRGVWERNTWRAGSLVETF
ncbi:MAG: hypothetical protein JRH07_09610 [Deltaproteobacteria bacterium]|nr:hypothetical protein [Deltaproteobacteria bacterium]MBW2122089.1 hypothetical protein [Deltaproteobacteria bacterium]